VVGLTVLLTCLGVLFALVLVARVRLNRLGEDSAGLMPAQSGQTGSSRLTLAFGGAAPLFRGGQSFA
jgi:hypothetical protein